MTVRIADKFEDIAARLAEIEKEKAAARARRERDEDASFEHSPFSTPMPDLSDIFG